MATYGEMMKEALAIKTQAEADKWFEAKVKDMYENYGKKESKTLADCADIMRSNLGYMAGYYDKSTSEHVHKFFGANHPIFGGPGYWDTVSNAQAFEAGKAMANKTTVTKDSPK